MADSDEVTLTFRRFATDKKAILLPMVNGLDVPHVTNCIIEEGVGLSTVTIVCNLPRGVVVE